MKRIAFWALPLVLIATVAAQGFAQAAAQEQPKFKDTKEYDDFIVVFNEKTDFVKKAANAEKFFADHKDADPVALTQMFQMMYLSYANASNWAKVLETYEKMGALAPKTSEADKARYLQIALLAATNLKNTAKITAYAEEILKGNPNDLNALLTLSGLLAGTLPAQDPAKRTQIDRTLEITNRALAQPKPQVIQDAQWNGIQQQLHETACLMLLNQTKYPESIAACQAALKANPKDAYAWYLIGMSHKAQLPPLIAKYRAALDKYNAEREKDPITVDENKTAFQAYEKVASDKKDEALDAFARAVAIGGNASSEAMKELKALFMGTPEELNKLIEEKKAQTGN
jgi:hypothetical protein